MNTEMNQSKKNVFQFGKKIIYSGLICKLYNNMNFKIDISP